MTDKKIISITEWTNKFISIISGYKINVYSDHRNMFHAVNICESQRVMWWWLIIEEFGVNIKNIDENDNKIDDKLSIIISETNNK